MFLLVSASPASPGPKAVKRLYVCVCVCVCVSGISASFTFHEAKLHIIIRRHLALPLPETNLLVS